MATTKKVLPPLRKRGSKLLASLEVNNEIKHKNPFIVSQEIKAHGQEMGNNDGNMGDIKEEERVKMVKPLEVERLTKGNEINDDNEIKIDEIDIVDGYTFTQTKVINENMEMQRQDNSTNIQETYLQTSEKKFIKLSSKQTEIHGRNNEMFKVDSKTIERIFDEYYTFSVILFGFAYAITVLDVFLICKETTTTLLQNYSSILYFIEFTDYNSSLLIACASILSIKYTKKYYTSILFVIFSFGYVISTLISFPIINEINHLICIQSDYFDNETNIANQTSKFNTYKNVSISRLIFASFCWIISAMHIFQNKNQD